MMDIGAEEEGSDDDCVESEENIEVEEEEPAPAPTAGVDGGEKQRNEAEAAPGDAATGDWYNGPSDAQPQNMAAEIASTDDNARSKLDGAAAMDCHGSPIPPSANPAEATPPDEDAAEAMPDGTATADLQSAVSVGAQSDSTGMHLPEQYRLAASACSPAGPEQLRDNSDTREVEASGSCSPCKAEAETRETASHGKRDESEVKMEETEAQTPPGTPPMEEGQDDGAEAEEEDEQRD